LAVVATCSAVSSFFLAATARPLIPAAPVRLVDSALRLPALVVVVVDGNDDNGYYYQPQMANDAITM
jgi:hypothetical protein